MSARWTEEKLQAGFEAFITEHGHMPTAHEVDTSPLLPSSRAIQKRFGGLVALREKLGFTETNLGAGENRSQIAHETGIRGRDLEIELEVWLQERFSERSVHTEKIFLGRMRVDFYVYTPDSTFGVDIFYADTMRTLQSSVNIKMKKYIHFEKPLFLVVANLDISQSQLDTYVTRRKQLLPNNIKLLTLPKFFKAIDEYTKHDD